MTLTRYSGAMSSPTSTGRSKASSTASGSLTWRTLANARQRAHECVLELNMLIATQAMQRNAQGRALSLIKDLADILLGLENIVNTHEQQLRNKAEENTELQKV